MFPTQLLDVTDAATLQHTESALAHSNELAIDLEADQMHHFHQRLCFVQIASNDGIYLLDTLAPQVSLAGLAGYFSDASRTKFFHAASGDLQYLAQAGIRVKGLFDTHRAATLLGWPKVGLADLVLEKLGVALKKEHQHSDFSIRPLPASMREYIADDVRYLNEIGRQVKKACIDADILEEVELDCARMTEEAVSRPAVGAEFKPKLVRQGKSPEQLRLGEAIALALHQKRLQWAEAADVPMGRMLSNAAISAIASTLPKSPKELQRCEGVRGAFVRQYGDETLALIADWVARSAAGTMPSPAPAADRDPARKKREERLKEFRALKAPERKVTPSVVLPNALIDDLSRQPVPNLEALSRFTYLGRKRLMLYGQALVGLLSG